MLTCGKQGLRGGGGEAFFHSVPILKQEKQLQKQWSVISSGSVHTINCHHETDPYEYSSLVYLLE